MAVKPRVAWGSFHNNADNVRSAIRNNNQPDNRNNNVGFRVASTLRQTNRSVMPENGPAGLVGRKVRTPRWAIC